MTTVISYVLCAILIFTGCLICFEMGRKHERKSHLKFLCSIDDVRLRSLIRDPFGEQYKSKQINWIDLNGDCPENFPQEQWENLIKCVNDEIAKTARESAEAIKALNKESEA